MLYAECLNSSKLNSFFFAGSHSKNSIACIIDMLELDVSHFAFGCLLVVYLNKFRGSNYINKKL